MPAIPTGSTMFQWDIKVSATNLKNLMSELKNYDRDLYKQVKKELVATAQPLATKVGAAFPAKPLEYWHSTNRRRGPSRFPGYSPNLVRRSVKTATPNMSRGASGRFRTVGILRLQQMNAGGQVYDMAGSAQKNPKGLPLIKNLDKRSRVKSTAGEFRSRIMFPFTKKYLPDIEKQVAAAIESQNTRIRARLVQGKA